MLKNLAAFLGLLSIISCTDDVSFNTPAFQAIRDTVFFKANISRAEVVDEDNLEVTVPGNSVPVIRLSGILNEEQVSLTLPFYGEGVFNIEPDNPTYATYISASGKEFSTLIDGEGSIVVERIEDSTYTGSFRFRARSQVDSSDVYFTKGYFYEVPFYKKPPVPEEIPVVATSFYCRINGNTFNPISINASAGSTAILGSGNQSSVVIRLVFPKNIEPGTYPLTDFSVTSPYQASYQSSNTNPIVQSGTLTITSHNRDARSVGGTFSFTAQGSSIVQITDGRFGFNY